MNEDMVTDIRQEIDGWCIVRDEDGKYYRVRIRKLTPRECGRLMDVDDPDITTLLAANSRAQCYKQFGNSIVVSCMEGIFRNLFIDPLPLLPEPTPIYQQLELF